MLRLSNEQWERIWEHFPEENIPEGRTGRKPCLRERFDAPLWILNTGAQWHMLPQCYPNYKTVHRHFQQWCEHEVLREVLTQLANTLPESKTRGQVLNLEFVSFLLSDHAPCQTAGSPMPSEQNGCARIVLNTWQHYVLPTL